MSLFNSETFNVKPKNLFITKYYKLGEGGNKFGNFQIRIFRNTKESWFKVDDVMKILGIPDNRKTELLYKCLYESKYNYREDFIHFKVVLELIRKTKYRPGYFRRDFKQYLLDNQIIREKDFKKYEEEYYANR